MNLRQFVFCLVGISAPVVAGEFYEVHPDRTIEGVPWPDHLTPVGPDLYGWQREYRRRIEDHLFQTDADIAQYVVLPSFGPESCVSIRSEIPKDVQERRGKFAVIPIDQKKYFITVTRASESLWYSMAENNEDRETRAVETSRIDREISLELAGAIHWAWGRMLHNTRYPATAGVDGRDGCTYQFSVWVSGLRNVSGETWSPQGGLPAEMVSVGDRIIEFAFEKDSSEEPLLKLCRDFEAKIPEVEPSPVFIEEVIEGPVDPFAAPASSGKSEQNKPE